MERKVEVVTEGKVIIAVYWEVTDEEGRVKPREATYAVSRDELALMAVGPPLKHDMLRGHFVRLLNQAFAETGLDREDGRQPPFKVCRLKHGAGPRGPHRYKRRKSEAAA